MMLYPPMGDLVDKTGSRYQLVNLVARRARNIASNAQEIGDVLNDKPVSIAIDEVYEGELSIRK
jgi:DNA-directed RNA polymerase subunit omega